ncbi:ribonuclease HII [Robertkochia sediminum]|uniref:ribonuclease HII n=1 Tax=Robertkochia sediminum TaxID=2785326 RepID=UPI0019316251|nr:ribonuclease HII [Robertkochia sediminum]MBL7472874.1 ribonuclease HII [Robertkochia sediminum]
MNRQFLLLAMALVLTFSCTKEANTPTDLIAMVPEKASAVVRINNFEGFKNELRNNELINTFGESTIYRDAEQLVSSLQYISPQGEALLYFSEIGKDNFEYTLITEHHDDLFVIDSTLSPALETMTYDNKTINKIQVENHPIYTTSIGKFFVASSSPLPVEDLIRSGSKMRGVQGLIKLYEVAQPRASATLFINNKNSNHLLSKVLNAKTANAFRAMSEWSSLDLEIDKNLLRGNGIAVGGDSIPNIINRFKDRDPGQTTIADLAPATSPYFVGLPNTKGLIKDLTNPKDTLFTEAIEAGFIKLGNSSIWTMVYEKDFPLEDLLKTHTETAEDYREHKLITLNNTELIKKRFGFLKGDTPSEYAAISSPYLFISDSKEALKDLIANIQNHSVASRLKGYKDLRSDLADASSLELYINIEALNKTAETVNEDLKASLKNLKDHQMMALQYVMEGDFAHMNLLTKKVTENRTNDRLITQLYNTTIDAPVQGQPQFVYNHRSKKKEVVVQDAENGLYLISTAGKVLWKKQLEGPILGKITQVDLYRNGRYQLAFATPGKMHIVDRNGNDVAPFPISPKQAITQPLAVFDYDKNKNYRFCLTLNNQVVLYDRQGKKVTGFNMASTSSAIANAPKHIRIANKDFIAVKETNGKLHLLHRTGEPRIKIKQNLGLSENEVYLYNNKFTTTAASGDLITIDAKGNINRTKKPFEASHKIDASLHTLAAISNNMLYIKDKKAELDYGMYTQPKIFYLYDKIYVAVTDKQSNKVYLFDSQAKLLENFPVYGASAVDIDDIDNDRKVEIVTTGDRNSIVVYSLK